MTNKNWKQKLQDKMAHYEEPAPDGLWESIERELPAVSPTDTGRGHTVSLWLGRLAGAAAAIALVVLLSKVWRNNPTEVDLPPTPMASTDVAPSPKTSEAPYLADIPSQKPAISKLTARIPAVAPLLAENEAIVDMEVVFEVEEAITDARVLVVEEAINAEDVHADAETTKAPQKVAKQTEAPSRATASNNQRSKSTSFPSASVSANRKAKNGSNRLMASLYASGATTDIQTQRSYDLAYGYGYARFADYSNYSNAKADYSYNHYHGATAAASTDSASPAGGISNEAADKDGLNVNINSYNKNGIAENSAMVRSHTNRALINSNYVDYKNETKHHQPLRGGVSLRYRLTDRIAIESGVTYTRMESEATEGSPVNYYHTTQTLHYIGIPANILYTVWEPKSFEIYVIGGGMAEKNLKGKRETTYTVSDQEISHTSQRFTEKPLQWSVNAGAGVQYDLNNAFGIYAEPGVSYYIDNKSKVDNYYKDKPWSFNLKIGLRYSFNR